jgi:hypothetical protein
MEAPSSMRRRNAETSRFNASCNPLLSSSLATSVLLALGVIGLLIEATFSRATLQNAQKRDQISLFLFCQLELQD